MSKKPHRKKIDIEEIIKSLEGKLDKEALATWPVRSLIDFREYGIRVNKSKRGNYTFSRMRPLQPSKWTRDELLDWLEGNIIPHRSIPVKTIWDEIYFRWKIPYNYSEEDARDSILHYKKPALTKHGLLVNDRRRADTALKDLTFAELCSYALGEIEGPHSKEDIRKRLMRIGRIVTDEHYNELLSHFDSGNMYMHHATEQIISVFEARKELYRKYGHRVTEQQLANNTKAIYNNLRRIMKADYGVFAESWRAVLKYVDNHYTTLFHPAQIRRGWPYLDLSGGSLHTLDRLLTLIVGTRSPVTRRKDIRHYNLDYILEFVNQPKERENMIAFYTEE